MNKRMVFHIIGRILQVEAIFLLFPFVVAIIYGERDIMKNYLAVAMVAFILGTIITLLMRPKNRVIYAKDGFAIVSLAWLTVSAAGAVPFVLTGEIPSYVDAFFETVSGFTTTGASILTNVEAMSKGSLFWRSFTHWIGGMGIIVFVMAILPNVSDRPMHILRAEVPGPVVGKLLPRVKDTAKILYLIYIILTIVQIVLLKLGDMPLFDAVVHSFGTAGTGGFGIKSDSVGGYSPYCQWVITIFMLLFGINFNLYFLLLIKRFKSVFKSTELWFYLSIVLISIAIITLNILPTENSFSDAARNASFQVASVITTTGYSTVDFNLWSGMSKAVLLLLMMIGACAGSTGGGLKVSRLVILLKTIAKEIRQMIHTRSIGAVHFEGKVVGEKTVNSVCIYFLVYILCTFTLFLIISFEPFGFETNFSAVVACFNNIGPGFGEVGAAGNYFNYTDFSKIVLSLSMLLGRLEIFPLLIFLSPRTWIKK